MKRRAAVTVAMLVDICVILALVVAGIGIIQIAHETQKIQRALYDRQSRWGPVIDRLDQSMQREGKDFTNMLRDEQEILECVRKLSRSSCH
jgi:predicted PurR-regulated permease PerM